MIVCPNCKHDNPEGATNCEACYTALPATKACPACGASIQLDATFCGQCGHNLRDPESKAPILLPPPATPAIGSPSQTASVGLPPTVLTSPEPDLVAKTPPVVAPDPEIPPTPIEPAAVVPVEAEAEAEKIELPSAPLPVEPVSEPVPEPATVASTPEPEIETTAPPVTTPTQPVTWQLLHLQTNTLLDIPPQLSVVHIGKPNDRIAPDIDVSQFPCAEVVSRIHANIRIEAENYYIEDIGSANGTYINHNVLAKGNRHLLRSGDRIGLGKGDLVTFLFQSSV
jgi:ribosomal protein L40E